MCFFMSFWFGKKSATNRNDQRLWQTNWNKSVGFRGVGWRGGVPVRRKRRGYVARELQLRIQHAVPRVAADMSYRLFRRPQILLLCVIVFVCLGLCDCGIVGT